jgi:hypothetical protein
MQYGLNGSDGCQHVSIADKAEMANAEDLPFEMVLTTS